MSAQDYEQQSGYLRFRYRALDSDAVAQYVSLAPATPLGHAQVSVSTTPTQLPNIPPNCRRVVIYSSTEPLTYTDFAGDTPGAAFGMVIPEGVVFVYDTDPSEDFLMWCPAASDVMIAYYG
jgi:hypothetical protein